MIFDITSYESILKGALLHPNKYSFEQLKLFGHPQLILV